MATQIKKAIKTDKKDDFGKCDIWQIVDLTSSDIRVSMSVTMACPLNPNKLQFIDAEYVMIFALGMLDDMKKHDKALICVDITHFPWIYVSSSHSKEDLINNDSQISRDMVRVQNNFTWENMIIPIVIVNMHIMSTELLCLDYKKGIYVQLDMC